MRATDPAVSPQWDTRDIANRLFPAMRAISQGS